MKSSQLNNENPPASASSPRDNPCLGSDSNIAALDAFAMTASAICCLTRNFYMRKRFPTRLWKMSRMCRRKKCGFILRVPT
jgi:hypothetical protein